MKLVDIKCDYREFTGGKCREIAEYFYQTDDGAAHLGSRDKRGLWNGPGRWPGQEFLRVMSRCKFHNFSYQNVVHIYRITKSAYIIASTLES